MRVLKLSLRNFKSFREASISFRPFNVVIGPNASGKSNLVQAFQFLKDISTYSLDNAVSLQGGGEFLRNMAAGSDEPVTISVTFDPFNTMVTSIPDLTIPEIEIKLLYTKYTLGLKFSTSNGRSEIVQDELSQRVRVSARNPYHPPKPIGEANATLSRRDGNCVFTVDADKEIESKFGQVYSDDADEEIKALFWQLYDPAILRLLDLLPDDISLLEIPIPIMTADTSHQSSPIGRISIYDPDPRLPKRGALITGKADLESDGSNLAIVLNEILRHKEESRKFHNLMGDLLPFVEKISVNRFVDNSLLVNLRESYGLGRDLPAPFLSDGTIGLTTIVVALAFERNDMTILEEPDRNTHPLIMSRLTGLMKDISSRSQVLVTTHNPEFVRYADIENLILVHRDKEGFSKVTRPAESDTLKMFLEEDLGIHELYVDGFLTIGA